MDVIAFLLSAESKHRSIGLQTFADDYKEMALLRQWEEQAQAAIHSQQTELQRRS